jgi:plastocyanin
MKCAPDQFYWAILLIVLGTFIAVTGCTGNVSSQPTPATPPAQVTGSATVNIQNFAFNPATITISRGTTVTWVNQDSVNHQVLNDADGSIAEGVLFASDSLPKGGIYSFKFDTPGNYPYHCSIHPSMKAAVIVT